MRKAADYMMIQAVEKVSAERYELHATMLTAPLWEGSFGDSTHAMTRDDRKGLDNARVLVRYSGGFYEVHLTGCGCDDAKTIAKAAFWAVMRRYSEDAKIEDRASAFNRHFCVHDFNQTIDQTEPGYYNTSYIEETDDDHD